MSKDTKQLTYEQRCHISAYLKIGMKRTTIAKELNVARSTITRELARNRSKNGYVSYVAQQKVAARRTTAGRVRQKKKNKSKAMAIKLLQKEQWSPEQISGRLAKDLKIKLSHQTIYSFIRVDRLNGGKLYTHLRHRGKKYNRHGSKTAGRGAIPDRVGIELRPEEANTKSRIGDFELDTIVGSKHRGAILSMVDRKSKLCKLVLLKRATAESTSQAVVEALLPFKDRLKTLTSDNGKEFAWHKQTSALLGASFFFAAPYSSWQRGLNEHTNGLARQYFPKKCGFDTINQREVQRVELLLNRRPRKCLNFCTPYEVFFGSGNS